ncbi:hypothetical protein SDC9_143026 [bioreactor metagenome]|uniref:Uncharacterized protein n=1 Tax=bioreactor metagenome TaxID=1076179 RepID=A0A645E277_9ZZZZ
MDDDEIAIACDAVPEPDPERRFRGRTVPLRGFRRQPAGAEQRHQRSSGALCAAAGDPRPAAGIRGGGGRSDGSGREAGGLWEIRRIQ